MPLSIGLNLQPKTLQAGVVTPVLAGNSGRQYLLLQNTGTGSVTFGVKTGLVAGLGFISLDPAGGAGGQGGSIEFKDAVPTNPIYAISTAGTTISASEG